MLTASEKECIIHRSYNISVGVSAAECLILFTLPFKIFPEDSSDGWELRLDMKFFLVIKQSIYHTVYGGGGGKVL